MLNMVNPFARKPLNEPSTRTLNVNRTGVADWKLSTLKISTPATDNAKPTTAVGTLAPDNTVTNVAAQNAKNGLARLDDTNAPTQTAKNGLAMIDDTNASGQNVKNNLAMIDNTNATNKVSSTTADGIIQKFKDAANGDGKWGGNYQYDLLDDNGYSTFTGTTSSTDADLDSLVQSSSAGGAGTDLVDELNKVTSNDPRIASTKAEQEQMNQQSGKILQLLQ